MFILIKNIDVSIGEAFGLSGVSILIVIAVLSLIMGLIYLMTFSLKQLDKFEAKRKAKKAVAKEEEISEDSKELAKGSAGDVNLFDVPDREAAMIMAIVADKTERPLNEIRFISIKDVTEEQEK
ncbi:MAG TPA: OadG family transporter subunit [Clostridia bacterium]|jgi:Na+-transporting methylmalonyl-CoA/oxaloacetate decarboxylase gamma subunit|nr:OadG family transporter subunit [Clostridia bacterium]